MANQMDYYDYDGYTLDKFSLNTDDVPTLKHVCNYDFLCNRN